MLEKDSFQLKELGKVLWKKWYLTYDFKNARDLDKKNRIVGVVKEKHSRKKYEQEQGSEENH